LKDTAANGVESSVATDTAGANGVESTGLAGRQRDFDQGAQRSCDRDLYDAGALGQLMRWQPVCLVLFSLIPLASAGCYQQPPPAAGCPAGHIPYQAADLAIRLTQNDGLETTSLRLPIGKVVVMVWGGICASGDALQALGAQQPLTGQSQSYGSAFRAVKLGKATLNSNWSCGEACMKPFAVQITVTNGCETLPRKAVLPVGTPDWTWSARLIQAARYTQLFAVPLKLAPDEPVWALLGTGRENLGTAIEPTPGPVVWSASAIDACTDYVSGQWTGTGAPAGWSSLTDQSPS